MTRKRYTIDDLAQRNLWAAFCFCAVIMDRLPRLDLPRLLIHLSVDRGCRWVITSVSGVCQTMFLHPAWFLVSCRLSAKLSPVHSLILSTQLFLCLPLYVLHSLCRSVLAWPVDLHSLCLAEVSWRGLSISTHCALQKCLGVACRSHDITKPLQLVSSHHTLC